MFGSIGFTELLVIGLLVAALFGIKKLPQLGRSVGQGIREFRVGIREAKQSISEPIEEAQDAVDSARRDIDQAARRARQL